MAADRPHIGTRDSCRRPPSPNPPPPPLLTPSPPGALAVNLQFPLNWIWWVTMAVATFALSSLSEICIYYLHDMKEIALVSPFDYVSRLPRSSPKTLRGSVGTTGRRSCRSIRRAMLPP